MDLPAMCLDHPAETGLVAVKMGSFTSSFPATNLHSSLPSLVNINFSLAQSSSLLNHSVGKDL